MGARNRNAIEMEAQRADTKKKRRDQQNKVDAANAKHHQSIEDEEVRHRQEMCDMKTASDAKTAKHNTKMERMSDKNKHRTDDVNHMALHFVSLENKLKQNNARCTNRRSPIMHRQFNRAGTVANCSLHNLRWFRQSERSSKSTAQSLQNRRR